MNTAIHFPQPVAIDEPVKVAPETPVRPVRTWIIRGLAGSAIIAAAISISLLVAPNSGGVPASATGSAELAIYEALGSSSDHFIAHATAISGRPTDDGWTVTVAAEVLVRTDAGFAPADHTSFFTVTLDESDAGWTVVSGPSQVAEPPVESLPMTPTAPIASPTTDAVQHYLDWLLTGAPGGYAGDRPDPAPYAVVEISSLAINGATAYVQVIGTDNAGRSLNLGYALNVVNQNGMWIVTAPSDGWPVP